VHGLGNHLDPVCVVVLCMLGLWQAGRAQRQCNIARSSDEDGTHECDQP
jgi:hypothetical protein